MDNKIDNYIGLEETANYLGVRPATVRNWIKTKDLPAHRIGKLWKFKRTEIDEWVDSGKSAN
ncbi:helix-turn-helix domain-containing protein [Dorea longicatena]|mgnify:CR=1 FL=1|jgi:excisionase family DNA binding protein|uniref:DNA binding domain, excisionase family n=1 Tax=Dorea longicatena TaxID=88431 RepID=A0A173WBM6_9FIRM|nr:helix-turn-helix domain-containing protein [Dorea longicatena]CUN35538.1 DNA binding domain%2C excisionase family [Dorea longicatena]